LHCLQALRQLVPTSAVGTLGSGGGAAAHEREVKAIAVSKDVAILVSASADSTLKVWNLENDSVQWTLTGHRDEVCYG
jgi:WD40 repeat protein